CQRHPIRGGSAAPRGLLVGRSWVATSGWWPSEPFHSLSELDARHRIGDRTRAAAFPIRGLLPRHSSRTNALWRIFVVRSSRFSTTGPPPAGPVGSKRALRLQPLPRAVPPRPQLPPPPREAPLVRPAVPAAGPRAGQGQGWARTRARTRAPVAPPL